MTDPIALKKALDSLSQKQHIVSDEAKRAKANTHHNDYPHIAKTNVLLHEMNRSVRILSSIFQASKFDELALFISRPLQLFVMQLCVGLIKGLGCVLGILIGLIFLLHVAKDHLPVTFFIQLHSYLNALKH